ncbi:MAG TPA: histidine phosphatase family protein [Proteiniclasticum sp.]|nr:histidine phosphatase family protein [Proteiniclasticum sp.]
MTTIYFVRHAEPVHSWEEDRSRPLSEEGMKDSKVVADFFREIKVDLFYSSPYKRSVDTISDSAKEKKLTIRTDERFRERVNGTEVNNKEMFLKRWTDFDYHVEDGESLSMVQKRNMEALTEILQNHEGKTIVIGTHGTALSTILNYYEPEYDVNSFLRIINYMPYIIRLDFDGERFIGKKELLILEKKFKRE